MKVVEHAWPNDNPAITDTDAYKRNKYGFTLECAFEADLKSIDPELNTVDKATKQSAVTLALAVPIKIHSMPYFVTYAQYGLLALSWSTRRWDLDIVITELGNYRFVLTSADGGIANGPLPDIKQVDRLFDFILNGRCLRRLCFKSQYGDQINIGINELVDLPDACSRCDNRGVQI